MKQATLIAGAITLSALALAGCGSGEAPGGNSGAATTLEPTDANLTEDPRNAVVPLEQATATVVVPRATPSPVATIPAAFRGRWGMGPADCDPARDDNKGLMTVEADRLRFYESRAVPRDLKIAGDTLTGTLDFNGEGQNWQETAHLVLSDGGRTLTRDTTDSGVVRYARCPA